MTLNAKLEIYYYIDRWFNDQLLCRGNNAIHILIITVETESVEDIYCNLVVYFQNKNLIYFNNICKEEALSRDCYNECKMVD